MLILVMADNLVLLFLGWEGVGLCSYLLIGFYLEKEAAAKAAKKAFVVNRIGDFCFIVALMFVFYLFGTFEISAIKNSLASQPSQVWIDWLTLLLFLSAPYSANHWLKLINLPSNFILTKKTRSQR